MTSSASWNHQNFSVPPEQLERVEECIDRLFPGWVKFVRKPDLIGYRLEADFNLGALYFRPTTAAGILHERLRRERRDETELGGFLRQLESIDPDFNDHTGILLPTVPEWEGCVERALGLERDRADLEVRVVAVLRPGDPQAPTDYLHQLFLRVGLLGPFRNTFEVQAIRPGS